MFSINFHIEINSISFAERYISAGNFIFAILSLFILDCLIKNNSELFPN